jgi:protein ImuB
LATTIEVDGRSLVASVNAAAADLGLAPGMSLADARAIVAGFDIAPSDPAADAALLRRLAVWCGRYSPWVGVEGVDGLFLDITGCAHLFGGERALLCDLAARLRVVGFATRLGLSDTPGAAWALARFGVARPGEPGAVAGAGDARAALASLSPAALRLDPATVGALERVGLTRIDALAVAPRASLAARFGFKVGLRLDQAFGAAPEPVSPVGTPAPYRTQMAFGEPIGLGDDIARGLRHLLDQLCARLEADNCGCRRLDFCAYRVDGTVMTVSIGVARAARDAARLARLFAGRLDEIDPGFGIETLVLAAPIVEPLTLSKGAALFDLQNQPGADKSKTETETESEDMAALVDRLGNRLGFDKVLRLAPFESHIPERAARAIPALEGAGLGRTSLRGEGGDGDRLWPATPPRPLRLLRRPERIEVLGAVRTGWGLAGASAPDGFLWRRIEHRVRAAIGPERIAPEWWRDPSDKNQAKEAQRHIQLARDYWRVEDAQGRRFWIYGLLHPKRPPEWFLHGLFA